MPLPSTRPKTVKPPFCVSRLAELSARLKNHWLVALLGSEPSLAMAIVPRTLLAALVPDGFGSLTTGSPELTSSINIPGWPSLTVNPPPWTTKPGTERWMNVFS